MNNKYIATFALVVSVVALGFGCQYIYEGVIYHSAKEVFFGGLFIGFSLIELAIFMLFCIAELLPEFFDKKETDKQKP